jgi:hypothetical protein
VLCSTINVEVCAIWTDQSVLFNILCILITKIHFKIDRYYTFSKTKVTCHMCQKDEVNISVCLKTNRQYKLN